MINNPIFTPRKIPIITHHNSNDIQRYQQAKKLAFELTDEAELLRQLNACFQLKMRIDHINNKMHGIGSELKGQVILICCMNIMETSKRRFSEYFPSNYWKHIQNYLISLSSQKKDEQNKSKHSISDTYRGKLKKSSMNIQKKKRNILDLLFIDRIDRVLKQIYNEIDNSCSQFLTKILTKSVVMVQRVLPSQQALQFKANISQILSKKANTSQLPYKPQSSQGRYIIIDQSLSIQKNKPFQLQRQSSNISINSKYYLSKQVSIVNSIDSSRKNDQQGDGKIPQKHRTSKRGSTSSNYSKRSSTLNGKSEERAPRSSVRWNKASIQIITNSYNRTKPLRKSNFQTIRQKQGEYDRKQDSFMLKASNSIIEEDVQQQKIFDSTFKELFVNGLLKSLRKMKEFYVMFYVNGKNYMAIVEEIRECQIFYSQQGFDKEVISIKIRIINQRRDLLLLSFPSEQFNRSSKEASCLKLINQKVYFYVNLFNNIKANIRDIDVNNVEIGDNSRSQNAQNTLFKIESSDQFCLIGFIRKISTHFICICRFNKKEIQQYNFTKWIRKMLQINSRFPKQILAQNQLKNTDLTMDFRLQQPKRYKQGSLITYIQDQQQQQQLYLQQQNYHHKLQTNTIKQHIQIPIKILFTSKQQTAQIKPYQLRRKLHNSRFGKPDEKQTENKKIKRTILNKNSIKLLHHMKEADLITIEAEAKKAFQNKFYRNQNEKSFDKRLSYQSLLQKKTAAKHRNKNQRQFVETVKTDKGYELIMYKSKLQIQGQTFESYLGYNQRNPKRTCYAKKMKELDFSKLQNDSKPSLSIHGKATKQIQNTTLITFLKPVRIEDAFGGHAITTIKLLSNNPNTEIFIQTYWQSRQKYYIFIITSQLFQKFTDINTKSFFQKPFIQHIEQPVKKKDRRTSVVASLIKQKELDPLNEQMHSNNKKLRHRTLDSFHEMAQPNQSNFMVKASPKKMQKVATIGQWQTMNRGIKTMDTCSTSKMMKISGRNQIYALKKEIVSKIKSKFVKHIYFTWRNFKLYLNIKNSTPTNLQSDSACTFQGSEVAIKNVYSKPQSPKQLLATQLILIRYFQNSLANLNFFSLQGMNKVYLQHLFIKNSSDLYGRYSAFVNLRDMIEDSKFNLDYKYNNSFFCTAENKISRHSSKDIKSLFSKTSSFQDQKKLKYQQILNLSKRCAIGISDIEQKKKVLRRKQFVIPNKYANFQAPQLLYKVQIRQQQILLKSLQGDLKLAIDLSSLYKLIPYASQLKPTKLKKIIIERILKDEDIIKLTTVSYQ